MKCKVVYANLADAEAILTRAMEDIEGRGGSIKAISSAVATNFSAAVSIETMTYTILYDDPMLTEVGGRGKELLS